MSGKANCSLHSHVGSWNSTRRFSLLMPPLSTPFSSCVAGVRVTPCRCVTCLGSAAHSAQDHGGNWHILMSYNLRVLFAKPRISSEGALSAKTSACVRHALREGQEGGVVLYHVEVEDVHPSMVVHHREPLAVGAYGCVCYRSWRGLRSVHGLGIIDSYPVAITVVAIV